MYGFTYSGGAFDQGVLYRLSGSRSGERTIQVVYAFQGEQDGSAPYGTPTRDSVGNFYGTTNEGGGNYGGGTVWKIDRMGQESILHSFTGLGGDGLSPYSGVVLDAKGSLYGVTPVGGDGSGTIYSVNQQGVFTVLHNFTQRSGRDPGGDVFLNHKGQLFGVTTVGGAFDAGTAWSLRLVR
jgi:uncharacterized repeat protein (TIGR03803 family)